MIGLGESRTGLQDDASDGYNFDGGDITIFDRSSYMLKIMVHVNTLNARVLAEVWKQCGVVWLVVVISGIVFKA